MRWAKAHTIPDHVRYFSNNTCLGLNRHTFLRVTEGRTPQTGNFLASASLRLADFTRVRCWRSPAWLWKPIGPVRLHP